MLGRGESPMFEIRIAVSSEFRLKFGISAVGDWPRPKVIKLILCAVLSNPSRNAWDRMR
jgi:hypothetical protein